MRGRRKLRDASRRRRLLALQPVRRLAGLLFLALERREGRSGRGHRWSPSTDLAEARSNKNIQRGAALVTGLQFGPREAMLSPFVDVGSVR